MEEDRFIKAKRAEGRINDGGWSPGLGTMLGIALCALLLLTVIILGVTTGIGFVFAIPLVLVALVVAVITFRGRARRVATVCPNCNARVNVPAHIAEYDCPSCGRHIDVGGGYVRRAA